jgi:hypothetical protein
MQTSKAPWLLKDAGSSATSLSLGFARGVEGGTVENEQAANDLPILDGHTLGAGRVVDRHRFRVIHDHRFLVVAERGNKF